MKVLAIVHQPDAGPGVFADEIAATGAELDVWSPSIVPAPPRDALGYAAVIALGGAMHADQEAAHPWLAAEKRTLAELLRARVPVLGVCLGAQLLAEAAGGEVRRARAPEIGWYEVRASSAAAGDPLFGELAPGFQALEWHSYEFSLPPGATALADSELCLQAFRVGPAAWGTQFHAEVAAGDFEAWLDDYASDPDAVALGLDPAALRRRTRERIADWNELGRGLCARFLAAGAG